MRVSRQQRGDGGIDGGGYPAGVLGRRVLVAVSRVRRGVTGHLHQHCQRGAVLGGRCHRGVSEVVAAAVVPADAVETAPEDLRVGVEDLPPS